MAEDKNKKEKAAKTVDEKASKKEAPKKDSDKTGKGSKEAKAPKKAGKAKTEAHVPRLQEKYTNEIMAALTAKFKYSNVMEVPKITKIGLNVGMGQALQNSKLLDSAVEVLQIISGQKPVVNIAKKSISNFKLREGNPIGCKVTLRKQRMYEFLDRFISLAIPRIRDFRGVSDKAFDGFGNYNIGVKEQIIFPEIDYDKVEMIHGLDINIVTTAKTDEECYELLRLFGMPFVEKAEEAAVAS